jgi:hypothetical protein
MDTSKLKTEQLILIIIIMMGLINGLMSCTSRQIAHKPTHREIKRAMKYSTSEYEMTPVKTTTGVVNQSRFVFEYSH